MLLSVGAAVAQQTLEIGLEREDQGLGRREQGRRHRRLGTPGRGGAEEGKAEAYRDDDRFAAHGVRKGSGGPNLRLAPGARHPGSAPYASPKRDALLHLLRTCHGVHPNVGVAHRAAIAPRRGANIARRYGAKVGETPGDAAPTQQRVPSCTREQRLLARWHLWPRRCCCWVALTSSRPSAALATPSQPLSMPSRSPDTTSTFQAVSPSTSLRRD